MDVPEEVEPRRTGAQLGQRLPQPLRAHVLDAPMVGAPVRLLQGLVEDAKRRLVGHQHVHTAGDLRVAALRPAVGQAVERQAVALQAATKHVRTQHVPRLPRVVVVALDKVLPLVGLLQEPLHEVGEPNRSAISTASPTRVARRRVAAVDQDVPVWDVEVQVKAMRVAYGHDAHGGLVLAGNNPLFAAGRCVRVRFASCCGMLVSRPLSVVPCLRSHQPCLHMYVLVKPARQAQGPSPGPVPERRSAATLARRQGGEDRRATDGVARNGERAAEGERPYGEPPGAGPDPAQPGPRRDPRSPPRHARSRPPEMI
mmetsp:Transcript_12103/g.24560  ORF Transcript_12103/g.24560 Transcript_12103/m.24560 type:complete len:313 (+) Transcript_12103:346-1284(+)